jgi:hypothetical protein
LRLNFFTTANDLNIRTRITQIEWIIADFVFLVLSLCPLWLRFIDSLCFSLRKTLRTLRLNFFTVANDFINRTRITQIELIIADFVFLVLSLCSLWLRFIDSLCFSLRKTLRTLRYNIKNNSLNSQLINKTEKIYTNEIRYLVM